MRFMGWDGLTPQAQAQYGSEEAYEQHMQQQEAKWLNPLHLGGERGGPKGKPLIKQPPQPVYGAGDFTSAGLLSLNESTGPQRDVPWMQFNPITGEITSTGGRVHPDAPRSWKPGNTAYRDKYGRYSQLLRQHGFDDNMFLNDSSERLGHPGLTSLSGVTQGVNKLADQYNVYGHRLDKLQGATGDIHKNQIANTQGMKGLRTEFDARGETLSDLQSQFGTRGETISGMQGQLGDYGTQMSDLQSQFGTRGETLSNLQSQFGTRGETISGMQEQIGGFGDQFSKINEGIGGLTSQYGDMQKLLDNFQSQTASFSGGIHDQLGQMEGRIGQLEQQSQTGGGFAGGFGGNNFNPVYSGGSNYTQSPGYGGNYMPLNFGTGLNMPNSGSYPSSAYYGGISPFMFEFY